MARRVGGEGSVILTRSPFTNWNRNSRLHWCNFMAVFFSFVAVLSLLCCGFCGAETEFSILEEAQVLAVQMKKLSSQELGVFNMQVTKLFKCSVSILTFDTIIFDVLSTCALTSIMNWLCCNLQSLGCSY